MIPPHPSPASQGFFTTAMSIKTSSTNAHLQRATPKPLRASGLHSVEASSVIYGRVLASPKERDEAWQAAMRAKLVAVQAPIRNSTMRAPYHFPELAPSIRPGAMDAKGLPSGGYIEQRARAEMAKRASPIIPIRRGKK